MKRKLLVWTNEDGIADITVDITNRQYPQRVDNFTWGSKGYEDNELPTERADKLVEKWSDGSTTMTFLSHSEMYAHDTSYLERREVWEKETEKKYPNFKASYRRS